MFWGLEALWPYQLTKPDFSGLGYFSGHAPPLTHPNVLAFLAKVDH